PPIWTSTSAIRTRRGSAAPTKTPTDCCVSTLPKALTCRCSRLTTSTTSPPNSTHGPVRPLGGKPRPKHSMNYSATRSNQQLLHRSLETKACQSADDCPLGWGQLEAAAKTY